MIDWLRKRPLPFRILVYAAAAILAFALAAGVGAIGALLIRGDLSLLGTQEEPPQSPNEQANAPRPQQNNNNAPANQQQEQEEEQEQQQQQEAAQEQRGEEEVELEEEYLAKVGQIQSRAVEAFLDSHKRLLRYDALGSDDLEQMEANEAALRELSTEVENLDAPGGYEDHYEVFASAIGELEAGVGLAHEVVAEPTTATKADFDTYDRHAREGADLLERSNQILGRDYKSIEGVQEISPL
jgi:hypothetical protein